ncbi:hypothetical protein WAI453_009472 [Rhynchosporium graminicola]
MVHFIDQRWLLIGVVAVGNQIPSAGRGFCCTGMYILESSSLFKAMTGHACRENTCDKGRYGYNTFASVQQSYWWPGKTVGTNKPSTVVTQFAANGGKLSLVICKYVQNGRQIGNGGSNTPCGNEGTTGGMQGMGQSKSGLKSL